MMKIQRFKYARERLYSWALYAGLFAGALLMMLFLGWPGYLLCAVLLGALIYRRKTAPDTLVWAKAENAVSVLLLSMVVALASSYMQSGAGGLYGGLRQELAQNTVKDKADNGDSTRRNRVTEDSGTVSGTTSTTDASDALASAGQSSTSVTATPTTEQNRKSAPATTRPRVAQATPTTTVRRPPASTRQATASTSRTTVARVNTTTRPRRTTTTVRPKATPSVTTRTVTTRRVPSTSPPRTTPPQTAPPQTAPAQPPTTTYAPPVEYETYPEAQQPSTGATAQEAPPQTTP